MATNSLVRCVSPLNNQSVIPSRSILTFFDGTSSKPIFSETRSPRLVSVRSQPSGSDREPGLDRSVSFQEFSSSTSSSSVIDFLTLCRRLKVRIRLTFAFSLAIVDMVACLSCKLKPVKGKHASLG